MWTVCRIDKDTFTGKTIYFPLQAAYRKRDLNLKAALGSGFVGPRDRLAIVGPDGRPR